MARRTAEQDKWHQRGFAVGTAVACAILVEVWGQEAAAAGILSLAHLTTHAKLKALGVGDYDLEQLQPVFRRLRNRRRRLSR